jgi:ankyrin repeat protein
LAHAAASGKASAVQVLIQWGASVNHGDVNGHTALIAASRHNQHHIVPLLVRADAVVDHTDRFGLTALMNAAQCCCPRSVQALLQAGANCEFESKTGDTALSFAVTRKHAQVIELLRAHGARS